MFEVRNYNDALEYIDTLADEKQPITQRDLCDIQKLITKDVLLNRAQLGNIRSIPVHIVDASTGKKIDSVPEPHFLKELLVDIWQWIEDHANTNPFVKAFSFHFAMRNDRLGRSTESMRTSIKLK